MSKLHFKGGPWTNAEDQVLKAALAQYGLRDWERVASMLTKKTASQCRERWENYLDPRLNIREAWSLEEEEKLVELQSLFPNRFRLIAEQLTRRTPTHYIRPAWLCEQRYLELKDEQEHYIKQQQLQGEGEEAAKQSLDAFMAERRRRRNARKTHEERAARADTISGERFHQEMIDMATSRLANQDQKKGLRKERQRQLEEAAFLAKLESNREGIESGTLSLRQSKKMRKALEEDRQSRGLVDMVAEGGDEEGEEGEEDMEGRPADRKASRRRDARSDDDDDESRSDGNFEAIDMYEDQQQAGLVKKQRVLMKDLTGQQRTIQQRQVQAGELDEAEGGDGSSGNRARAALTGVNHDLLRQLTAGPSAGTTATTTTTTPLLRDGPSLAKERVADAQHELQSTIADLFAALPQAQTSATAGSNEAFPAPLPPPPLKRPRDALPSIAQEKESADLFLSSTASAATSAQGTGGIPDDLFGSLNLPPPRKHVKADAPQPFTEVQAESEATASAKAAHDIQATSAPAETPLGASADATKEKEESSSPITLLEFSSAEEEEAYVGVARQWVAVECEKATIGVRTASASSTTMAAAASGEDAPTATPSLSETDKEAVTQLIDSELLHHRRDQSAAEALRAVDAYVQDVPRYTARVNVQSALHELSAHVAAQVQEANNVLQPLRDEWERVVSVAMLPPRALHVLQGYVRDDGRLKQPAGYEDADEFGSSAAQANSAVAMYVYEHLVNQLTRARQATQFLRSLRDREQLKMRRDLDAAEFELHQLQAREKVLQDMYRQKRVQQ